MNRSLLTALCAVSFLSVACSERHDHGEPSASSSGQAVLGTAVNAPAQVQQGIAIQNAWVRPTVGEQDATGAYLSITTQEAMTLVGVASPAAEIAEIHEMKMDGDVMRMRMAPRIDIKPGETLELKPGGYHVMLMALTGPVEVGQEIELSLQFEKADGSKIEMPVKALAGQTAAGGDHHHHGGSGTHKH